MQQLPPPPPPRNNRTLEEKLVQLEKILPTYDGTTNIHDFLGKFDSKLNQYGITGDGPRCQLLKTKLLGAAYTAVRVNEATCRTYQQTALFLKETYAPSVDGVKAALIQI